MRRDEDGEDYSAKAADKYGATNANVQQKYGRKLLEEELKVELCPGKRILDIGCGTGDLAAFCAKSVFPDGSVVAVDPETERIRVAKETFHSVKNLRFHVATSIDFPIVDGKPYDAVFSNAVLHWVDDSEKLPTLKRIFSSLKSQGLVAINVVPEMPPNMKTIFDKFPAQMQEDSQKIFHPVPKYMWESIAREAGFEILKSEIILYDSPWSNLSDYLDWIDATHYGKFEFRKTFEQFKDELSPQILRYDDGTVKHVTVNIKLVLKKP